MWREIMQEGGKSLWREIGVDMLRKGAATLVIEGVKAGVDLFKQRRLRREVYEFDQWKKAQEELREKNSPPKPAEKPVDEEATVSIPVPAPEVTPVPQPSDDAPRETYPSRE